MEQIITGKKYYVKPINSGKAYKFTSMYHYSRVGFRKSILNLGVFRNEDKKLVGVLQWGCSFQENIRLDRYVKEDIKKGAYLELNRFCMADEEAVNAESQAISLGVKWIRTFRKEIKLLVSYAGRKEGNYGFIYQATNWEYLGYFISEGFWFVDGEEKHLLTLYFRTKALGADNGGFLPTLMKMYKDIRKTWTKQFIYIIRLDDKLTPATEPQRYPKPHNEYPIKTQEHIYKQDDEVFNNYKPEAVEQVEFYDEGKELLFSKATLRRRGEITKIPKKIAVYDKNGFFLKLVEGYDDIADDVNLKGGIQTALSNGAIYKQKYYRRVEEGDEAPLTIPVAVACVIDGIPFKSLADAARHIGVTRQAISAAKLRGADIVNGFSISWRKI